MKAVWAGIVGVGLTAVAAAVADEDPQSLGTNAWPAVTNGFVFIDGRYIEPPYVVTREESVICVNVIPIDKGMAWPPPPPKPPLPPPETDPPVPDSITEDSTKYDHDCVQYIQDKRRYLKHIYGEEPSAARMVDVYRSLPCVQDVILRGATDITVIWKGGENFNINMEPQSRQPPLRREEVIFMADSEGGDLSRDLDGGGYHIWQDRERMGGGGANGYDTPLRLLADALATNQTVEAFLDATRDKDITYKWRDEDGTALRAFWAHRADLPKWEPRLPPRKEEWLRQLLSE